MKTVKKKRAEVSETFRRKFWSRVNKQGPVPAHMPQLGPCWVWMGGSSNGYGQVSHREPGIKSHGAHRIAWELRRGPVPPNKILCHKCDNPRCVRLSHLFAGDGYSNAADMALKGRGARWWRKLDPSRFREVRSLLRRGQTAKSVAKLFNVTPTLVSQIAKGPAWKRRPQAPIPACR